MSFGIWSMGIYHVILTWYQIQVKGHLRYWSRSQASVTAHDNCSRDILFLTIFGSGELLHYVRSIFSSEDLLLFHTKLFPFSLAMVILQFRRYTVLFFVVFIYLFRFQSVFIYLTRFVTFSLRMLFALHLWEILANQKKKKKKNFSCVCSRPYTSMWSRPIKSSKKSLQFFGGLTEI